jgi:hypothetical protein
VNAADVQKAHARLAAATASVKRNVESVKGLNAALVAGDAADVAAHPDLAYLDLQLKGFYGDRPPLPEEDH